MSELKEGHYVYTDLGIERVHWCIVNGEKELVTPKGYILGDVPNYELEVQTVKRNMILTLENAELKNTLAKTKANGKYPDRISRLKSRVVALSEENTKLKEQLDDYKRLADMKGEIIARMEDSDNDREKFQNKKIAKLKELLKRARGLMNCTKGWACTEATEEMITKINQVLGED